ncbi:aminotransferase class IV [Crassaminicella profunda]|uniref:aminotransferase class IV n=1 Tax=Crassaminicella profunda TaxID=1286698 RepID=UPI001CA684AB|nr:aminotransferase class IV [Crassaminicella profunda]QZY55987.1 aminotransferase class IV [Crassaminicella profunda]
MKGEAFLDYYIYNGEEYATEKKEVFFEIGSPIIYEVIRVIDGVPLFLEEHLERMRKSAQLLGVSIQKPDEIITDEILRLIQINKCKNMNVKLLCSSRKGEKQDFFVYFIKSHYPTKDIYEKGIHTILYDSERENPNAKVINTSFREHVNQRIKEENAFEALLVNKEGTITEGSRSNMFFVKGEEVLTAPAADVLLGVTRKRIMKVCKDLNIPVREKAISIKDIDSLDGAFMSGTSVNVLPIRSIDQTYLDAADNKLIMKISKGYIQEMKSYIEARS